MSEESSGLPEQSISVPIGVGLVVVIVSLLYLIANANWFTMDSPTGMVFQTLIGVLFCFTIFIAPILLVWKTNLPIWFIGLGCGLVSTTLVQTGVHSAPEEAEAIGSLLCLGFVVQSAISAGIAFFASFLLKRIKNKAPKSPESERTAVAESYRLP